MILELDCGNSRIKWRLVVAHEHTVDCYGVVTSIAELLLQLKPYSGQLKYCRICSVKGELFDAELASRLAALADIRIVYVTSNQCLDAVVNGYEVPEQLGVDRWLGIIAAYQLYRKACVVIDCGTAVTVDFVDEDGKHLGGAIAPGMRTLALALTANTGLPEAGYSSELKIGRNTSEALKVGISSMFHGFLDSQIKLARSLLNNNFQLVLAGGDAVSAKQYLGQGVIQDDLVLDGLKYASPYGEE